MTTKYLASPGEFRLHLCRMVVPRLYRLCVEFLVRFLENVCSGVDLEEMPDKERPMRSALPRLAEDMQMFAYSSASGGKTPGEDAEIWRDVWEVFLSPRTESALVCWDRDLLSRLSKYCPQLLRILICQKTCDSLQLDWIPNTVLTLDFDGEIFYRGKRMPIWDHLADRRDKKFRPWLPEAEALFKALFVWRQTPTPAPFPTGVGSRLIEIHLGATRMSTEDLMLLLGRLPELQLLRHYQMVRALYVKHQEEARKGETLPRYKLRNLDVDFSHVTRCRMSPEAVLSREALPLAVRLCPWAEQVRVRCDPATPHDALAPLLQLRRLRELCVACVTSGERSLLDFADILPLLQRHGPSSLVSLQLKVMEEVDVHEILQHCPRLERLLLSGCGNVSSPSCTAMNSCSSPAALPRLRLLFFADGDDFSWDHALPSCFWMSALGPGEKPSRLEGLFLESPRIPPEVLDRLGTWPHLKTLSLCRCPELRLPALLRICKASPHLRYVRASQCDNIGTKQRQRLQEELPQHVVVVVDD